ncbi:MAG TPA: ABC transporter permease [Nocardioides sp.]|nr:ABC transporter permease [Nocardioides sp.]
MTELAGAEAAIEAKPDEGEGGQVLRTRRGDAWRHLKQKKLFWISMVLILIFVTMAIAPWLFTDADPREAVLSEARESPSSEHWFGRDIQGYDLYSRCIYGARASILVGLFSALGVMLIGGVFGLLGGYASGWVDSLVSRFAEIFFALPLILGAIIILTSLPDSDRYVIIVFKVVAVLVVLGWPSIFRLMRSSVLQVKPNDYVQAARALGASPWRVVSSHILPNAMGPVIVVTTINLGVFIAAEASLSFLGIGLKPPTVSWGVMISDATRAMSSAPHTLLFPAIFLSFAVLSFIMLGDAIRDAFDPKR